MNTRRKRFRAPLFAVVCVFAPLLRGAEVRVIYPELEPTIAGKEVDWIYGDYVMKNDQITLIIAAPIVTRDANLTVRQIGASILDISLNEPSNDQLSAFIPTMGNYVFHDPSKVETGRENDGVFWKCRSSKSLRGDGTAATVTYRLRDDDPFVTATIVVTGEKARQVRAVDGVRADRTFKFSVMDGLALCEDPFFRQCIGFAGDGIKWVNGRPTQLLHQATKGDGEVSWETRIYPATSKLDLIGALAGAELCTFEVQDQLSDFGDEAVTRATLKITGADTDPLELRTDDEGRAHARLTNGTYQVETSAIGFRPTTKEIRFEGDPEPIQLKLADGGGVVATIVDGEGRSIPAKATIYRTGVDPSAVNLGPDSTRTFVKNCVYSVHGAFRCPLDSGEYEIVFSRGPEYNRVIKNVSVEAGEWEQLQVTLPRVVDTSGWVSTELHSHSSPSGDNVSDQYGRVENLLCEHLEFAPCTEHNRISSYTPHLKAMGLVDLMATCSGIELTGRPLPANHQNSFPLHHHPHTQNGGGPRTDVNPVVQIERLAMWDGGREKLVQQNHPNLHQIYGDLDVDGNADAGFRGMLQWMDVIEVHPPQTIFEDVAADPPNVREMRIPLFQWLQLLNDGYRIPGVVNTDAHYNHHGSGWLRNWFKSSSDEPSEIDTMEMVRNAEAGHIIMSTGPFMTVRATSKASDQAAIPGSDLKAAGGKVTVEVKVQCPNWLDINRVQIFVNGRPEPTLNRTRRDQPTLFGDSRAVVKFDSSFEVELDRDAHLIVGAIGEGMTMQKVMGENYGNRPPIAVSNPIFVDVDGGGFKPNGDGLGLPLPKE
ncbi:MAG: CehA/McbA family metallohydrolase [Planctomycetota bacterium]